MWLGVIIHFLGVTSSPSLFSLKKQVSRMPFVCSQRKGVYFSIRLAHLWTLVSTYDRSHASKSSLSHGFNASWSTEAVVTGEMTISLFYDGLLPVWLILILVYHWSVWLKLNCDVKLHKDEKKYKKYKNNKMGPEMYGILLITVFKQCWIVIQFFF